MSYKLLQLSPQSARETNMRIAIRGPWSVKPVGFRDVSFLRSWLVYDSEFDRAGTEGRITRHAILGLALAIGISGSFWTAVGLAVAHAF